MYPASVYPYRSHLCSNMSTGSGPVWFFDDVSFELSKSLILPITLFVKSFVLIELEIGLPADRN